MPEEMNYGEGYKYIPTTSVNSGVGIEVLPDIYCHTIQIVNVVYVGDPESGEFVLIDAGMPRSADKIIAMIEERFGENKAPKAIILTHGHFDHVGGIIELLERWDIPVYAHSLEIPFLTGEKDYPEPDETVEGGMVAKMSPLFPNEAIDLGDRVQALPDDGSVPFLSKFRWLHTPGHAEGHISLFREADRLLLAGDAFVNVKQDALYKVMTQEEELTGPPRYLTPDWKAAKQSVEELAELQPKVVVTGHGVPVSGERLEKGLQHLAKNFDQIAVPDYGRYVDEQYH